MLCCMDVTAWSPASTRNTPAVHCALHYTIDHIFQGAFCAQSGTLPFSFSFIHLRGQIRIQKMSSGEGQSLVLARPHSHCPHHGVKVRTTTTSKYGSEARVPKADGTLYE